MPLYTADALILRSYVLGETSRIVVFLTRDRGKKRGVAKGARRARSRFAGAIEPLTEARVAYFESERRELVGLNYAEVVRSPLAIVGRAGRDAGTVVFASPAEAGLHDSGEEAGLHDSGGSAARLAGPTEAGLHDSGEEAGLHDSGQGAGLHDSGGSAAGLASPAEAGLHDSGEEAGLHDSGEEAGLHDSGGLHDRGQGAAGLRGVGHDAGGTDEVLGYIGYFAELLDEWAQEADADERLYRLGASMLDALAAGAPIEPLARYFECWLLRLQGVYPESRGTLSAGAAAFLDASRRVPPHAVGTLRADRRVMRELEGVHRTMIARHLEKTLKSDRVIRDLRRHA